MQVDSIHHTKRHLFEKLKNNKSKDGYKVNLKKILVYFSIFSFFVATLMSSFFYFGKLGANYIVDNVQPIALFKDGKYLILLQNNSELRSSGGFIGSYAVANIKNLEIQNIDFNTNIYALDRLFSDKYYAAAPSPLAKFLKGKTWALRDSNYDASFDEAAQDILFFYNKETNDSVDGIIALNAQVIIDLLKLSGPINLAKYNLTVDANNFYDVTQYQVEKGYYDNPENWVINEPKSFLKDLYPEIVNRALTNKIELVKTLNNDLKNNEIIFYFQDEQKQKIAQNNNWAGKIPTQLELQDKYQLSTPIDYLYINQNSYSGNKSSIKLKETIDYKVTSENNKLKATLRLTLSHVGSYSWPDGPNDTWIRIFVSPDSSIISTTKNGQTVPSQDLTIAKDAEKTFFGYQLLTNPGQSNILEFSYYMPFNTKDYHLLVQKQPGAENVNINVSYNNLVLTSGPLIKDVQL